MNHLSKTLLVACLLMFWGCLSQSLPTYLEAETCPSADALVSEEERAEARRNYQELEALLQTKGYLFCLA